jgi:hypothetical protein
MTDIHTSPANIPNPDPSVVANARLEEAKASIRRDMATQREEAKGWIDTLQRLLEEKINRVEAVTTEKFHRVEGSFVERDTRTEQTAAGVKIAVDAALQAAKEAVAEQNRSFALATGKSETATMKQIDALGLAIQTANKGLDDKIADMKDRLTRIEGMDLGSARQRGQQFSERLETHGGNQNWIAIAALAAAIVGWLYTATRPTPLAPAIVYAQPGGVLQAPPPLPQRQVFPLVPTWDSNVYRIMN